MMIGGIYGEDGEYAISNGRNLFYLFDGISDIEEDVELNGQGKLVEGYCLSLDTKNRKWKIRDTGHKGCRHVLAEGSYSDGFVESMKPIMSIFGKEVKEHG